MWCLLPYPVWNVSSNMNHFNSWKISFLIFFRNLLGIFYRMDNENPCYFWSLVVTKILNLILENLSNFVIKCGFQSHTFFNRLRNNLTKQVIKQLSITMIVSPYSLSFYTSSHIALDGLQQDCHQHTKQQSIIQLYLLPRWTRINMSTFETNMFEDGNNFCMILSSCLNLSTDTFTEK